MTAVNYGMGHSGLCSEYITLTNKTEEINLKIKYEQEKSWRFECFCIVSRIKMLFEQKKFIARKTQ